jgi:hypothetical protein
MRVKFDNSAYTLQSHVFLIGDEWRKVTAIKRGVNTLKQATIPTSLPIQYSELPYHNFHSALYNIKS